MTRPAPPRGSSPGCHRAHGTSVCAAISGHGVTCQQVGPTAEDPDLRRCRRCRCSASGRTHRGSSGRVHLALAWWKRPALTSRTSRRTPPPVPVRRRRGEPRRRAGRAPRPSPPRRARLARDTSGPGPRSSHPRRTIGWRPAAGVAAQTKLPRAGTGRVQRPAVRPTSPPRVDVGGKETRRTVRARPCHPRGRSPGAPGSTTSDIWRRSAGSDACLPTLLRARTMVGEQVEQSGPHSVRLRTVRPTRRDDRSRAVLAVPSRPRLRRALSPPPLTARATGLRPSGVTSLPCAPGRDRPVPPCPGAPPMRKILALTLAAALALAGCSRAAEAPSGRRDPGCRAAPRLLPEHHPRSGADRRRERLLPAGAGLDQADHADVQRGWRRDRRAAGRLARRGLHRLQPGHQRLRQVQRRGRAGDRGLHVRWRPTGREPGHHLARAAQEQDRRDAAGQQHRTSRSRSGLETTSPTGRARTR